MEEDMGAQNANDLIDPLPVDIKEDSNLLTDGSKDYKGQIAARDSTGGWRLTPLIFAPEACEKMAVVSIAVNIVPYLTSSLHLSSSYSANLVTTYQGTSYLLALIGGFIADARLGRYRVIVGAGITLFLGLLLITLATVVPALKPEYCMSTKTYICPPQTGIPLIVIYISVYLIALGTGGIKSSASAFGADQFDPNHEKEKKNLAGFFSWYFFGISSGAVFSVTILIWVQDNKGRDWGYLIPTLTMLCVVIAFVFGRRLYRYKDPKGSPLTHILQVFVAAYRKRNLQLPSETDKLFELEKEIQPYDYVRVKRSNQFKFLDKAAIIISESTKKLETTNLWQLNTVTRVEETKMVIRLMPIVLTTSLFYTIYAQSTTFSVEQGLAMHRMIGKFEFPAASMSVFLQVAILLTVTLWEKMIVPIARRITGNEKGTTSLQRIGIGLVISIFTTIVAALVERKRLHYVKIENLGAKLAVDPKAHLNLTIFWLLPQYILVGIGEALTYSGQLDFFYNESPKAMRSMGSALCICTLALGYYASSLLVLLVNSVTGHQHSDGSITGAWLPSNIKTSGRLDNFYWLLAVASTTNFLLFLVCARWYKYKTVATEAVEDDHGVTKFSIDEFESDVESGKTDMRRNVAILDNDKGE